MPMVLHKEIFFMRYCFVFVILFTATHCSHGNHEGGSNNSSIKTVIIEEILKKVSNITLNTLSKVPAETKESILHKIEKKLKKSAKSMGHDADKYVKLIMEEFETTAFNKEKGKPNEKRVIRKSINLRTHNNDKIASRTMIDSDKIQERIKARNHNKLTRPIVIDSDTKQKNIKARSFGKPASSTVIDSDAKQEIIKDIVNKVQSLAKNFMRDATTVEKKKEALEKIKKKIMDAANQKHTQIHHKHEALKAYSSLISQGIEISMQQLLADDARRMESEELLKKGEDHIEYEENPTNNRQTNNSEEEILKRTNLKLDLDQINKYKKIISHTLNDTSLDSHCGEVVADTCKKIQSFNKISCEDGKNIPIENLCNGVVDCSNRADEENCTGQAMQKVREANAVMSTVEEQYIYSKCFEITKHDNDILQTQNDILRDVLNTQMNFLELHISEPLKQTDKNKGLDNIFIIKKTVSDVGTILSTLSYALDGTLCANRVKPERAIFARKFNDIELDLLEGGSRDPKWSPKSCSCRGQYCENAECDARCKRICWQKHSLNHWGCESISGETSVSLNVLCDGKLDCFDESDETLCATDTKVSKFEAGPMYNDLLDLLAIKSKSFEFVKTRSKLVSFHGLVRKLQKLTTQKRTDSEVIKSIRNESFKLLVSIYEESLEISDMEELDDVYLTLLTINQKLVAALKRSHTGNVDLLSSNDCYCRGGMCALRRCTKNCVQTCLAEPLLTRYPCTPLNITVPIETICNGKDNCPNGEDEKHCKTEICRGHHLVVLRHRLENVSAKHKGTFLGEVLNSWKNKISAALVVAESSERPNHKTIIDIVSRVLGDLVIAFAALEDYRKYLSDTPLHEFINISKIVMDTLKSCSN